MGRGPQTDKHLPQSQFFKITTFGIGFYQSNLSTFCTTTVPATKDSFEACRDPDWRFHAVIKIQIMRKGLKQVVYNIRHFCIEYVDVDCGGTECRAIFPGAVLLFMCKTNMRVCRKLC